MTTMTELLEKKEKEEPSNPSSLQAERQSEEFATQEPSEWWLIPPQELYYVVLALLDL